MLFGTLPEKKEPFDREAALDAYLRDHMLPAGSKGFQCIRLAVMLVSEQPSVCMDEIYEIAAQRFEMSYERTVCAMRYAVLTGWVNLGYNKRMTNEEFIRQAARWLHDKEKASRE